MNKSVLIPFEKYERLVKRTAQFETEDAAVQCDIAAAQNEDRLVGKGDSENENRDVEVHPEPENLVLQKSVTNKPNKKARANWTKTWLGIHGKI